MATTKQIKNANTKKIADNKTKSLPTDETKQLKMSESRAKKIKHSYKVKDAENSLLLKLKDGDVVIEMYPDVAPNHVARIKELVRSEFYNGLKFQTLPDYWDCMLQHCCKFLNILCLPQRY